MANTYHTCTKKSLHTSKKSFTLFFGLVSPITSSVGSFTVQAGHIVLRGEWPSLQPQGTLALSPLGALPRAVLSEAEAYVHLPDGWLWPSLLDWIFPGTSIPPVTPWAHKPQSPSPGPNLSLFFLHAGLFPDWFIRLKC